ncbi:hypothetical protein PSEUDO8AS_60407 [Pseudomonas sp. 8AS]|nr:hypothetical protein PSEUDO8AS_60407 [Pseudomonas sp. 8AS]
MEADVSAGQRRSSGEGHFCFRTTLESLTPETIHPRGSRVYAFAGCDSSPPLRGKVTFFLRTAAYPNIELLRPSFRECFHVLPNRNVERSKHEHSRRAVFGHGHRAFHLSAGRAAARRA